MCQERNKSNGITKRCPHCGLTKVLEAYYQNKRTGRVYSWCKVCDNEKHQSLERKKKKHEYYLRNKAKKIAYSKLWIQNNRAKHRKYNKLYKLRVKYETNSFSLNNNWI